MTFLLRSDPVELNSFTPFEDFFSSWFKIQFFLKSVYLFLLVRSHESKRMSHPNNKWVDTDRTPDQTYQRCVSDTPA